MPEFTNAKQVIPSVFKHLMENDNCQAQLRQLCVIPFSKMAELIRDHKNLRTAAERMLRWNVDKGESR